MFRQHRRERCIRDPRREARRLRGIHDAPQRGAPPRLSPPAAAADAAWLRLTRGFDVQRRSVWRRAAWQPVEPPRRRCPRPPSPVSSSPVGHDNAVLNTATFDTASAATSPPEPGVSRRDAEPWARPAPGGSLNALTGMRS
jgi:hypothetical protein